MPSFPADFGPWKHREAKKFSESADIIQHAAVKNLPGYKKGKAPAIELEGPSTKDGSPHFKATRIQDQKGGKTYAAERRIAYKALRRAGLTKEEARLAIKEADDYFIGKLKIKMTTPLPVPGNR